MRLKSSVDIGLDKESLRVLHAEDSDDCAILVRRALKRAGFGRDPLRATDGEKTIALLSGADKNDQPHVILLDVNMPLKSGFEVLDWIRHDSRYGTTPVVMLTASQEAEIIEQATRLGATGFLPKDGTYRGVVEALEKMLRPRTLDGE